VILQWKAEGRNDRVGFNVSRSTGWAKEFRQGNAAMIPLQTDASQETAYTFVEADIVQGTQYYDILENGNAGGITSSRGP
jgi:hypothetical protein